MMPATPRRAARATVLVAAAVLLVLGGCGIKGPLKPPPDKAAQNAPAAPYSAPGPLPVDSPTPLPTPDRVKAP